MSNDKLESAKRRITALLDRADHPNTDEHEAAACREKAEALMAQYRIERAMLHLKGHDKRRFEVKEFRVNYTDSNIFVNAFDHTNCHVAFNGSGYSVVGYPEDIFYGETLFDRARTEVHATLYPTWQDERSLEANIYAFRRSGSSWQEVWTRLPLRAWEELGTYSFDKNAVNKLTYRFRKHEEAIGAPKFVWRKDRTEFARWFRSGFSSRFAQRLYDLKRRQEGEAPAGEYALALRTDDEALREEFYTLFPQHRPATDEQRAARKAQRQAEARAEEERKANLTEAQRRAEEEKEAREKRAADRRWQKYLKDNTPDDAAWAVGTESANKVRLLLNDEVKNTEKALA